MPKKGNAKEEYEDSFFPKEPVDGELDSFRCAIADGATETSFAKSWADILVKDFVEERALADSRQQWEQTVSGRELAWYAEEKASQGAFAALAGLIVHPDKRFEMAAAGDSCLVHSRNTKILLTFPKTEAKEFDNRPALLCSKAEGTAEVEIKTKQGEYQDGDQFWLLTDAVAHWALSVAEKGENPLDKLSALTGEDLFTTWVSEQRALLAADGRPLLVNDDLTIFRAQIN
jgi:hypothetical protein